MFCENISVIQPSSPRRKKRRENTRVFHIACHYSTVVMAQMKTNSKQTKRRYQRFPVVFTIPNKPIFSFGKQVFVADHAYTTHRASLLEFFFEFFFLMEHVPVYIV